MKIAICDDKKVFLDVLSRIVETEFNKLRLTPEITTYMTGEAFLTHHKLENFDVVFLDIVMPDMDGFEVAKEIRKISRDTYVVFVTTESNLVYDSFDFRPFNFIPKGSVDNLNNRVSHVINKLVKDIEYNVPIKLELPYDETRYIKPKDILYVKSRSNYIYFVLCSSEAIQLRGKIDNAVKLLPSRLFARIHNRIIVNMQHIAKIDNPNSTILLDNKEKLEFSRAYKQSISEAYNSFMRDFS